MSKTGKLVTMDEEKAEVLNNFHLKPLIPQLRVDGPARSKAQCPD